MGVVKTGIIGIGNIGRAHFECIMSGRVKGMKVTAVCDLNQEKLDRIQADFPKIAVFENYNEFLEKADIDTVIISVPHLFHSEIGIAAFQSGKNVLVEKPIDITLSAATRLNESAKQSGKKFGIMFNQRTNSLFEKARKIVQYREREQREENSKDAAVLIRRRIVRFTLLSAVTGIIRTSVIFWLPTYLKQYLGYGTTSALKVYAVITFCTVIAPFLAAFLIERLHGRMSLTMMLFFAMSSCCFLLCYVVKQPIFNSLFLAIAIIGSNGVSSLIWCRYCPSLKDTGMVSTATGYLDFISYVAAALANLMFADAVAKIGWGKLILVWCAIMIAGMCISIYREASRQ